MIQILNDMQSLANAYLLSIVTYCNSSRQETEETQESVLVSYDDLL